MSRQNLFFGFVNLFLGIILYVAFILYIPSLIESMGVPCEDTGPLSCGGLSEIVKYVAILVSIVGIAQILYWMFVEREKEKEINVNASRIDLSSFKICPECNTANDLSAKYCKECGADLSRKK